MHVRILIEKEFFAQNEIFSVCYCFCQIKEVVGMIVIPKGFFFLVGMLIGC